MDTTNHPGDHPGDQSGDHPGNTPGTDVPGATDESGGKPIYTVAAVNRALDLLDILSQDGPASLARIAGAAGCTRTAAFRLLRTMAARGYVAQDGARGLWRLGSRFSAMQGEPGIRGPVATVATPVLDRLARETHRVVYLVQRIGQEGIVIALSQTDLSQRRYSELGTALPLHAGCGRLLLAFAPEPVQAQVLAGRLSRFSPATIIDPRRLAIENRMIRGRGWFASQDELIPGSIAFSAPVRDARNTPDWMLTIACPVIRVSGVDRRVLLRIVISAAEEISTLLRQGPAP
jgi:IclR family transcriptional regulator, KDG regulon repressor